MTTIMMYGECFVCQESELTTQTVVPVESDHRKRSRSYDEEAKQKKQRSAVE
jgi:hypothetical protein